MSQAPPPAVRPWRRRRRLAPAARSGGLQDPVDRTAALGARLVGPDLAGADRLDREPKLLPECPANRAADGMVLPACSRGDLLDRRALGAPEHLDHAGLLGAGAVPGLGGRVTAGCGLGLLGWPGRPLAPGGLACPRRGRAVGLAAAPAGGSALADVGAVSAALGASSPSISTPIAAMPWLVMTTRSDPPSPPSTRIRPLLRRLSITLLS